MPVKTISTGRALMGGGTYADKVLSYGPIAYWPLWEANGTAARCLVNPAQTGLYRNNGGAKDVSTYPPGPGIGDGNTAPYFDTTDYVNTYTATLAGRFNGSAGSLMVWAKVLNVGIWTDGAARNPCLFAAVINVNDVHFNKSNVNNRLDWIYVAGGVTEIVSDVGMATTNWMNLVITWSAAADEVKAYLNGIQDGATQTILGVWAGALDPNRASIGSASGIFNSSPWNGWLAHCALWNRVLSAPEIASLGVV